MKKEWPKVRLEEILSHRKEFITIDDLTTYRRPRVQLHAQGVVLRDEVPGALIKTKTQQVCRAGELLVAEIDAKVGGFGIVPESLDGSIVSSHYFLFDLDEAKLDRGFLKYFISTPGFREQVAAQGSTNYAAIRPADVLSYEIPLPPLAEQRRIVARIEKLAAPIHEARTLRQQAGSEMASLESANVDVVLYRVGLTAPFVSLESVSESITDGDHLPPPKADTGVPFLFISHVVRGAVDFTNCKYVPVEYFEALAESRVPRRGDVLYTTVGSYGVPCLVDTDQPFCFQRHVALIRPKLDRVSPRYLLWALRSRTVFNQATSLATGSAQLTVPLRGIRMLSIPLPEMTQQRRIVAELDGLQVEVDMLRRLQAESAVKLDALLPAILDQTFKGEL